MIVGITLIKLKGEIFSVLDESQLMIMYNSNNLTYSYILLVTTFLIYRWVVGPKLNEAHGGIMILSQKKCPWNIAFGFGRLGKCK